MASSAVMDLPELTRLIDEIVNAPYAVSLSSLHNLIRQRHKPQLLETWSQVKACQIKPLAGAIAADLSRHYSTLHVLAAFVGIQDFRDTVLQRKPAILDSLLELALSSDRHGPIAFQTCATILATPLPLTIPVSEWLKKFIENVVESVIETPCSQSTTVLRRLVTSSPKLLETLPEALITSLAEKCKYILSCKEAHLANLNCMSIAGSVFKTFYVGPEASNSPSTQSSSFLSTWAAKAYQLYVQGPKVSDNIKNTILRAIFFYKPQNATSEDEIKEVLRNVLQILEMIEPELLLEWGNDNSEILQMLSHKAVRDDIFTSSRFYAFAILTKIDPRGFNCDYLPLFRMLANTLVGDTAESLEAGLGRSVAEKLVNEVFCGLESNLSSLPRVCEIQACTPIVKSIFHFVLEQCRPGQTPRPVALAKLRNGALIVHAMQDVFKKSPSSTLASLIIDIVNETRIPDWWTLSLAEPSSTNCVHLDVCPHHLEQCRLELTHSTSDFLVKAASTTSRSLQLDDFGLVFDQIANARMLGPKNICKYNSCDLQLLTVRSLSLAETAATSNGASLGWKDRLDSELQRSSGRSRQIVLEYVTNICRDLQNRCDNVEEPLRTLKAKAVGVQEELHAAQEMNTHAQKEIELLRGKLSASELRFSALNSAALRASENAQLLEMETDLKFEQMDQDFKVRLMQVSEELVLKSKHISRLEVDMMWLNCQIPLLHQELRDTHEADFVQLRQLHDGHVTVLQTKCDELQGRLERARKQQADLKILADASEEDLQQKLATISALIQAEASWKIQRAELETSLVEFKGKYARILAAVSD